jgi:uncharacterized protein
VSLIIDGYNLLHATGILGVGHGPGSLERSRVAVLNFVAESLPPDEVAKTIVVFDASDAPWGAARQTQHKGLTVHFAAKTSDADSLIEELILADSAPRRLTVVSSDHRLHRAARRRKATAIDSDQWFAQVLRERRARQKSSPAQDVAKPEGPFSPGEVEFWLRQFGESEP